MRKLAALLLVLLLTTASRTPTAHRGLPIVNDDYAGARATAQGRHVPMFVEAWAPW